MTDMQQPAEGVVHGIAEATERAPEPPPSGPWVWMRENLFSGDTPLPIAFNTILTIVFALVSVNILRFVTSGIFSPDRRWSAVTWNMKLLMVQAYPRDDLARIWLSIGIFFVLISFSLVAWNLHGRLSTGKLFGGIRSAGVLLALAAIFHGAGEADTINLGVMRIDSPADWSSIRLLVFLVAVVLAVGGHFLKAAQPTGEHERTIPFLSVLVGLMALITLALWTIQLPWPEGQFDETTAPIADTTRWPWTILFIVSIVAFFVAKPIRAALGEKFRRVVVIAWIAAYPVIIMVIQRNPILRWEDEILGFGETAFLESDLGTFLVATILGGAAIWIMALPETRGPSAVVAGVVGVALIAGPYVLAEVGLIITVVSVLTGLGVLAAALFLQDRHEMPRVIGAGLFIAAVLAFFVPMAFLIRTLLFAFAFVALATPSFGGTVDGRRKITMAWILVALLVIVGFRLGVAETALEFQGTTFLGGFNLSILLAIAGIALSFPAGLVLALARTSTMPIFRLLATGYIELVRSVPLITWLFFGSVMLAVFLPRGVEYDEIVRIVGAIAIFNAAYVAENIRGGLQSIGKGQYEASRAMGLSTVQSTSLIILPQAIRAVIPALVGSIIVSFKDTSLVAIIGLADVLLIAKTFIPAQSNPNFQATQPQMLFFMALFYWIFTFTFSRLSLRYEKSIGLGTR